MCYSALVWARYTRYIAAFKAEIDIGEFAKLYVGRAEGKAISLPRATDADFARPRSPGEFEALTAINAYRRARAELLRAEIVEQSDRLAAARAGTTKAAQKDAGIAERKVSKAEHDLADLDRAEVKARDNRIYPHYYAPVMIAVEGKRVVRPMRYLLRPAGFPESFDRTHKGAFNARRNNLDKFWRKQFTHTHCVVAAELFYEWVERPDGAGGVRKQEIEFDPRGMDTMLAAGIWSRWHGRDGEYLDSFALVTDEPPPEVAAAGHDRCIIPLRQENVDEWLNPLPGQHAAMQAILDDRERPYYEHREAA
jgi:putative SOS response-associated peptidase YedK